MLIRASSDVEENNFVSSMRSFGLIDFIKSHVSLFSFFSLAALHWLALL
jgi:hypothetical protein